MISDSSETIAGIATAIGKSAIGVVRLSGEDSFAIAAKFFHSSSGIRIEQKNRTLTYGWVKDQNCFLDEALACVMRKPNSYTAEDVVEIQCHGSSFILQRILEIAIRHGARLARPGEFTQRAFLNGRIDLTQAEAANDLIRAKTDLGISLAVNQLKGKLYRKISALKETVSWTLSLVNAGIDFPEEDIVFPHSDEIDAKLQGVEAEMQELIASADIGIMVREGVRIVLVGAPNVGKSTILNGLLQQERSIVTELPGTTRDTIEESCVIGGIPISITDTAGIRRAENLVEKEGINRTFAAIEKADLLIWIMDATKLAETAELPRELRSAGVPILKVLNKKDCLEHRPLLLSQWEESCDTIISAISEKGIDMLRTSIFSFISDGSENISEDTILTNLRQKTAVAEALESVRQARKSIREEMGEEYLSADLSAALNALGHIIGETTPDEMLNRIFNNFCIGK